MGYQIINGLDSEYLEALKERFWEKVERQAGDGCWEWQASRNLKGYGHFGVLGLPIQLAHRVSYELNIGPIPKGLYILHRCDNPPCIRPEHLFAGTNGDNVRDAIEKGRWVPSRGYIKLDPDTVTFWRNHFDPNKHTVSAIARELDVVPQTVKLFLSGETHVDVPGKCHTVLTTYFINDAEKQELFDAYERGLSVPEIIESLTMHQASAYRLINEKFAS